MTQRSPAIHAFDFRPGRLARANAASARALSDDHISGQWRTPVSVRLRIGLRTHIGENAVADADV